MPRPKQRTTQLRAQVLACAHGMLARHGPAALTARSVASEAGTSTAAVYELFGSKSGLVRELFFEGFRRMAAVFEGLAEQADPRADLLALTRAFREFAHDNPALVEVMFSRPFQDFEPGREELALVQVGYRSVMKRVKRAIETGLVAGDPTDVAIALMATVQGLAAAERAGRLGQRKRDRDRRFALACNALISGLAPDDSSQKKGHTP